MLDLEPGSRVTSALITPDMADATRELKSALEGVYRDPTAAYQAIQSADAIFTEREGGSMRSMLAALSRNPELFGELRNEVRDGQLTGPSREAISAVREGYVGIQQATVDVYRDADPQEFEKLENTMGTLYAAVEAAYGPTAEAKFSEIMMVANDRGFQAFADPSALRGGLQPFDATKLQDVQNALTVAGSIAEMSDGYAQGLIAAGTQLELEHFRSEGSGARINVVSTEVPNEITQPQPDPVMMR